VICGDFCKKIFTSSSTLEGLDPENILHINMNNLFLIIKYRNEDRGKVCNTLIALRMIAKPKTTSSAYEQARLVPKSKTSAIAEASPVDCVALPVQFSNLFIADLGRLAGLAF
jgi:hypothetical protein